MNASANDGFGELQNQVQGCNATRFIGRVKPTIVFVGRVSTRQVD